ncbi:MAG: amidohydrolase family protein [Microscillaceae bacterium]|nr:amidohydrolase family protein [Microscillaceae bacterium]
MKIFNASIRFFWLNCLFLLTFEAYAQPSPAEEGQIIAIRHVNVIPMDAEKILKDQTVLIEKGLIKSVKPDKKIKIPEGAQVIDGQGKYLTPGLAEMHAHIPTPKDGNDEYVRETLFLYLSNGVTTIRGMLGDSYHLELKKKVAAGEVLSPRIYTSSPSVNGNSFPTIEVAKEKVPQYKKDGYDFLKLHPGIKLEVFEEIIKQAKEVGITYSGHVSVYVGVRKALQAPYASIDHIDGYLEGLVPASAGLDPEKNGFFGINFTDKADMSLLPELVEMTKKNKVWVVPTQALLERWLSPQSPAELIQEEPMKYMPSATRYSWVNTKQQVLKNPDYNAETYTKFIDIRRKILKALYDAQVGLLLGSDAPQVFNVPGFSIQGELKAMQAAGIPNYEILKMGTVNPAAFFGESGKYGMIKPGNSADLILVDGNPLEDIGNMSQISGVMVRGQWLSRAMIDEELEKIAKRNEGN